MINIERKETIKIYNDGILLLEGDNFKEIEETIKCLLNMSDDEWEIEILNEILYTMNTYLSTMEVA